MNVLTRYMLLPLLWLCVTQEYAFQNTPPEQSFSTRQSVNSEQHIQEYSYSDKHEPLQTTPLGGCNASPIPGCNYPTQSDYDFHQKE